MRVVYQTGARSGWINFWGPLSLEIINNVIEVRFGPARYLPLDIPAYLPRYENNLLPRRPVTERPIYPCDSRSKIDPASLELYPSCQEFWSPKVTTTPESALGAMEFPSKPVSEKPGGIHYSTNFSLKTRASSSS